MFSNNIIWNFIFFNVHYKILFYCPFFLSKKRSKNPFFFLHDYYNTWSYPDCCTISITLLYHFQLYVFFNNVSLFLFHFLYTLFLILIYWAKTILPGDIISKLTIVLTRAFFFSKCMLINMIINQFTKKINWCAH